LGVKSHRNKNSKIKIQNFHPHPPIPHLLKKMGDGGKKVKSTNQIKNKKFVLGESKKS